MKQALMVLVWLPGALALAGDYSDPVAWLHPAAPSGRTVDGGR